MSAAPIKSARYCPLCGTQAKRAELADGRVEWVCGGCGTWRARTSTEVTLATADAADKKTLANLVRRASAQHRVVEL
jgi:hypothetical protein